ncbi:hypothetical protein DAPPUDRAFT_313680 [Daphnia pulex]|uniref:Threonine synthase-like 2 n=1 Tax=Daphnia pulex TaxID=6669 RepID=E9G3U3_DAPPU|nr:hypothetical protein DAPPUDRAFT_313680 [Daphnia pulex]|eukprot:EFX85833.1 hypothetical protein DAPPUDRAFT_313680 [Daphnia pulex]
MKYRSTRSSSGTSDLYSFEEVLFSPGYAKDGGLYVCDHIPTITKNEFHSWKDLKYPGIVQKILRLFTSEDELTDREIEGVVASAYKDFEYPEKVVHLEKLDDKMCIAELFQGPTLAFKDLSLAVLAKLLEIFLKKKGQDKRVKILVGTSGDTGPAAAHSVANLERVDLVLLYPLNRVSKIQELQMLTVKAPNVHICSVEGSSDDLDQPIKECFQDQHFSAANSLGSFNSIQWGRVLLQAAHYVYIYLQCCPNIGDEICIAVPTGAAGNLAAGFLAREMGFPIKLVATVNSNDILARTFQYGDYSPAPDVAASLAPAMDIQAPYNIERVLYFATHGDALAVRNVMQDFEQSGKVTLSAEILSAIQEVIVESVSVSDSDIVQAMQLCHSKYNYVICPHTATAVSYCFNVDQRGKQVFVCLATASPAKFPEACEAAGLDKSTHHRVERLKLDTEICTPRHVFLKGHDWTSQLKDIILKI